jgi:arylsulfatase A-like enzyme
MHNIGRVLDTLDQLSIADNTIVILFSDNGGPPTTGACNLPLAGSKFTLWEGGIRVPFILARPEESTPATICDGLISTLDILPTCLQAAGIEMHEGLDGQAIPKDVTQIADERDLFWRWGDRYAVRSGDWKLLHKGGPSGRAPCDGIVERTEFLQNTCLFNLKEDPGESTDLSQEHPEIARRLQEIYDAWSEDVGS